jgi:Heterokaryon incompatibility protein (HET)
MALYDGLPLPSTEQGIRLIAFRPAKDPNEPLAAELLVVSLDTNPQYATISYCWGSPTPTRPMTCNNTVLEITESLALGLTRFRAMSDLLLWVDQICINQGDVRERNAQVAFMKRIYSQATKTFAYLGEPDSDISSDACRVLESLKVPVMRMIDFKVNGASHKSYLRSRIPAIKLAMQHPSLARKSFDVDVKKAIVHLLSRPYFFRKWIIQELVMSQSLFCIIGPHCFSWDAFLNSVLKVGGSFRTTDDPGTRIQAGWLFFLNYNEVGMRKHALLTLLYYSRYSQATDPRDHVFALLGAACDSDDFPKPDYEMAVDHLYHEVSCCLVRQGKAFLMFHLAGMRSTENGLPSWVVDWRDLDTSYSSKYFAWFHAGGLDGNIELCKDNTIIRARGKLVDRVVAIGDPFKAELKLQERLERYISNCTEVFEMFYEKGTTKEAIQKDLASLISFEMRCWSRDPYYRWFSFSGNYHDDFRCADIEAMSCFSSKQLPLIHAKVFAMLFGQWLSKRCQKKGMNSLSRFFQKIQPHASLKFLTEYELLTGLYRTNAQESCFRGNFFKPTTRPVRTENHRLGLAPALTQIEDVACVLLGAKAPLILRPSENGTYKIVGEAYVQDIMFGATLNDERYPVQDILIS